MCKIRLKITVQGRVQGVGFRPTVYRYALERNLAGWVTNTSSGVIIEIEGKKEEVEDFIKILESSPPPMADITDFSSISIPLKNEAGFRILASTQKDTARTQISPDIATCKDCRKELLDPFDRRFQYPFINCTNCGPRFTIVKNIPYDRDKTTMKEFIMCPECRKEYEDPLDRRFHAQPQACPDCGPQVKLVASGINENITGEEAISECINLLKTGRIGAIKGLGGFHLSCDATNDDAVMKLRRRKFRYDKPFALMVRDLETIKKYAYVSNEELNLLTSPESPITLLKKKKNPAAPAISENTAPGNSFLGFMLPYTPLHILLFSGKISILVMTSGNVSGEPIAYENEEAMERLGKIADFFLIHNRKIQTRCDDSVIRIFPYTGTKLPLRRSRGYAPSPVKSPFPLGKGILAAGAHLNNTFALARENEIFPGHHIGDLENLEALKAFECGIEHFERIFEITPELIACDLHPEYFSSKYAIERSEKSSTKIPVLKIQHHHAHIASCMADNLLENQKVIGVAFDGTGLGTDGTIWGGEFLVADYSGFDRIGHLKCMPLPGGDMASKEPWRMGAAYLYKIFGQDFLNIKIEFVKHLDKKKWSIIKQMIDQKLNCMMTSSMGRLFGAVSSLCGIRKRPENNYEGQAAIELEMAIKDVETEESYSFNVIKKEGIYIIDPEKIIRAIVEDLKKSIIPGIISLKFHNTIADIILNLCKKIREDKKINSVALSGGVFQNLILLDNTYKKLESENFKIFIHQKIPPNDGGIAAGQAVIAAKQRKI
jgi:hydrogenase maturation protein HypF